MTTNLSKNEGILKTLIESSLRRNAAPRENAQFWLNLLRIALLDSTKILIYGDSGRFVEDFIDCIHFPINNYQRLYSKVTLKGHCRPNSKVSVVILHTGARTEAQHAIYQEIVEEITTRPEIIVWHIGNWR
jgi:hypothetical protein